MKPALHDNEPQKLEIVVASDSRNMDHVGKIRYAAYRSVDAIESNATEWFLDHFDVCGNHQSHLLLCEGTPIGSIRACLYDKSHSWSPTAAWRSIMRTQLAHRD